MTYNVFDGMVTPCSTSTSDSNGFDPFVCMLCVYMTTLVCVCVLYRDVVREVVRLLLALNARSHAVSLARQTNVSLAD